MFSVVVLCSGPREDATRIGSAGVIRRQAVDISPLRRVNSAIYLISTGAREASFRNIKTIAECLADELINAAKGSSNRSACYCTLLAVACLCSQLACQGRNRFVSSQWPQMPRQGLWIRLSTQMGKSGLGDSEFSCHVHLSPSTKGMWLHPEQYSYSNVLDRAAIGGEAL